MSENDIVSRHGTLGFEIRDELPLATLITPHTAPHLGFNNILARMELMKKTLHSIGWDTIKFVNDADNPRRI